MRSLSSKNGSVRHFLCGVNVLSKYCIKPLKYKKGKAVLHINYGLNVIIALCEND